MQLKDYGLTRDRGFLSAFEIDEITIPARFNPIVTAAERLHSLEQRRPKGVHAAVLIEDATLICAPDSLHRGWELAGHSPDVTA